MSKATDFADSYMNNKYGHRWGEDSEHISEWYRAMIHYETPPMTKEVAELDKYLSQYEEVGE